jgi:hypothetical protein
MYSNYVTNWLIGIDLLGSPIGGVLKRMNLHCIRLANCVCRGGGGTFPQKNELVPLHLGKSALSHTSAGLFACSLHSIEVCSNPHRVPISAAVVQRKVHEGNGTITLHDRCGFNSNPH